MPTVAPSEADRPRQGSMTGLEPGTPRHRRGRALQYLEKLAEQMKCVGNAARGDP
jgi:hypothetical protein